MIPNDVTKVACSQAFLQSIWCSLHFKHGHIRGKTHFEFDLALFELIFYKSDYMLHMEAQIYIFLPGSKFLYQRVIYFQLNVQLIYFQLFWHMCRIGSFWVQEGESSFPHPAFLSALVIVNFHCLSVYLRMCLAAAEACSPICFILFPTCHITEVLFQIASD